MKRKEQLREIGEKLLALELKSQEENSEVYMNNMAQLVEGLTLEDILYLDEYVSKKLLTK